MNGVEILASSEVVVEAAFNWSIFKILLGLTVGFCLMIGISLALMHKDWTELVAFICIGLIVGSLFGALFGRLAQIPLAYAKQYKVTISDEVRLNDFLEKYEILDHEGKIYTVRERR